jgi:serine/threonine protein kinase
MCGGLFTATSISNTWSQANVLVDSQGRVRLTDFGLAITLNATVASATVGSIGTPYYMAPELWDDGVPAKASDVYALGMTVWQVGVPHVISHSQRSRDTRSTVEYSHLQTCRTS